MFRSQTDEQLAAKCDPMPTVRHSDGKRGGWDMMPNLLPGEHGAFGQLEKLEFRPRVECIPSRDPEPYLRTYNGGSPKRITAEYAAQTEARYKNNFGEIVWTQWAPRPEFARPPVNRVLTEVRVDRGSLAAELALLDNPDYTRNFTPAEINHARKALTRLANLERTAQ